MQGEVFYTPTVKVTFPDALVLVSLIQEHNIINFVLAISVNMGFDCLLAECEQMAGEHC